MLKASEANRIANGYQSYAKKEITDYLEKSIISRAKDGFKWFPWDYNYSMEYDGLTTDEKQEIIFELRNAGYDVKDRWMIKQAIIRW